MPCLAGRSSWMICLMFSNTLTLPTFGHCRRRETEIKHGRVAMFATMGQKLKQVRLHSWMRQWPCMNFGFFIILVQGYIAPEYYRFDGYLSPSMNLKFSDVPNGLKVQLRRWCRVIFSDFQRFSLGFNMFCFNDIFSINVNFRCFIIFMLLLRGLNLGDLDAQLFPPKSRRSPWCPKRAGRRSLLSLASSSWLSTRRPPSQAGFMLFAVRGLGLFASWHFLKAIMERATSALAWSASATPSRILRQGPSYMTTVITWYCMQLCTFFRLCLLWSSHVFEHVSIS